MWTTHTYIFTHLYLYRGDCTCTCNIINMYTCIMHNTCNNYLLMFTCATAFLLPFNIFCKAAKPCLKATAGRPACVATETKYPRTLLNQLRHTSMFFLKNPLTALGTIGRVTQEPSYALYMSLSKCSINCKRSTALKWTV